MVLVGKVEVGPIHQWAPAKGSVVSWQASPASLEKARQAPRSSVPASYQQAQHIRRFCDNAARGIDMSRLLTAGWDIPGQCDIRVMTHVINTHLRRHDAYHSWFEYEDGERVVRRTLSQPGQIKYAPVKHGEMTAPEVRSLILGTPNPLRWDSFRFLIIQYADHFTFCVCVDHLHLDAMFVGVGFMEIHLMYATLAAGRAPVALPPAGSYDDFCVRQGRALAALTVESPPVRAWVDFFEDNGGTLPQFPLPLGDPGQSVPCDMLSVQLLDEGQTARFESACMEAGARFSGGVFACAALVEHELTGAATYHGIIPVDTRSSEEEFMTTGWFVGFVPISVPADGSFADTARAAQASFDAGKDLSHVPIERVFELAPWLKMPRRGAPLLFFLDAGVPPLSALVNSHLEGVKARLYHDGRIPSQVAIRVNRLENETQMVVLFPNNATARESVIRFIEAVKSVYSRVADCGGGMKAQPLGTQVQPQLACPSAGA